MKTYNFNLRKSSIFFSLAAWSLFFMSLPTVLFSQYCDSPTQPGSTFSVYDWTTETFTVWLSQDGQVISKDIPSPFYPSPLNIGQPNTAYLWGVPLANDEPKDFLPEEGWELLYLGLGTPDDPTDIPSLALYHRPSGKIRLLAYLENLTGNDYSELYIEHADTYEYPYISAVLEHASMPIENVEGYLDKNLRINSPNKIWDLYPGSGDTEGIWMVAEIPAFYDPCVCQYSSGLKFGIWVANTIDFTIMLTGNGQIEQVFPASSNNTGSSTLKGIQQFHKGYTKGVLAYKNIKKFLDMLDALTLSAANSNLGDLSSSQQQQLQSLLGANTPVQNLTQSQLNQLWQSSQTNDDASEIAGVLLPGNVNGQFLPSWIKQAVPFAGAVITVLDFIAAGGKSATTPRPMRFNLSSSFTGSGDFLDSTQVRQYIFKTPGAAGDLPVNEPIYDNPLGVLSIVNEIKVSRTHVWYDDEQGAMYYDDYQLTNPLQYAVNPASGLNTMPKDIRASLRVIVHYPIGDFPPPSTFPVWVPETGLIRIDDTTYRTPYLPLSCLPAYKIRLLDYVEGGLMEDRPEPQVYLHLIASFEKENAQAGDKEAFFAQLYKVSLVNTPPSVEENTSLLYIPESVNLQNIDEFLHQNPTAWNGIRIEGDVTLTDDNFFIVDELYPPQIVTITSPGAPIGHQTTVSKTDFQVGDVISGGFVLENLPDCYQPVPPLTASELSSFCSNTTKYHPVNLLNIFVPEEDTKGEEQGGKTRLYPNPSQGSFTLEFKLDKDAKVWIHLMDQLGQINYLLLDGYEMTEGMHRIPIETESLPEGTYFVKLQIEGETEPQLIKWINL